MRNDARPTGEQIRDVAKDARKERSVESDSRRAPNDNSGASKPFVTDHDPGDEENPPVQKPAREKR
jgi:hypothetical protein